jgi:hypothetical protein
MVCGIYFEEIIVAKNHYSVLYIQRKLLWISHVIVSCYNIGVAQNTCSWQNKMDAHRTYSL